jgi:hypothetical protein
MRKAMLLLAVFGFVGLLWAQSPFDGTWKVDLNTAQFPEKPQVVVLQNSTFQCSTCDPKINVKADGTDQPVQGSKDYDTLAVKVVDNKTVETTSKKGGRVVESSKTTASADGKTVTAEFTYYPEASKQPVTGKETLSRVAAGPSGSHAISGSWRIQKANVSENALTVTYKSSPNGLMMSDPMGESFDAKFDGKDYPVKGVPAGYTVSLTKVNDRSIDATNKRDGKIVGVDHITVSADGKTMSIQSENKVQGTTATYTATKQ